MSSSRLIWQYRSHDIKSAKADYQSGNYSWLDLKRKYDLPTDVIFKIIFESRRSV